MGPILFGAHLGPILFGTHFIRGPFGACLGVAWAEGGVIDLRGGYCLQLQVIREFPAGSGSKPEIHPPGSSTAKNSRFGVHANKNPWIFVFLVRGQMTLC